MLAVDDVDAAPQTRMFRTPEDEARRSSPEERAALAEALRQSSAERSQAKAAALEACSPQQAALLACYRGGSFVACAAVRQAFWACFRKHRGFEATLLDAPLGRTPPPPE